MGYQALLFCPEEKTARTVTQVLSELEFAVETCAEPFAAVKKLMGEHFDAIVVDCDNEQNATLLFKSARNSTSNQSSLAVAVVEGQAGVAKAFRIGANLVLTKPINVEQAKGTLRVARGLLRKGEPVAKPAAGPPAPAAAAAPAASPAKQAPEPAVSTRPAVPAVAAPPAHVAPPALKPSALSVPSHAVEASRPNAMDEDLLELNVDEPPAKPAASIPVASAMQKLPPETLLEAAQARPAHKFPGFASSRGGAASAPAPAREPKAPPASSGADTLFQKPASTVHADSPASEAPAPTFTFGGANAPVESSGGSKKIFVGVAAAVVVAVGIYFAWAHFQGSSTHSPSTPAPVASSEPAKPPAPVAPPSSVAKSTPSSSSPAASLQPATKTPVETSPAIDSSNDEEESSAPTKEPSAASTKSTNSAKSTEAAPAPLMVKRGAAPAIHKAPATPDAPAPSLIGIAAPASAPPPDLGSGNTVPRPVLQTLNISQGVSQGLLIKKVQPIYPQNALAMHTEGSVELLATISRSGNISSVKVLAGPPLLTRAATDAVKQWKYKPYLLNGEPVEIQTQVTINFKLPH